MFEGMDPEQQQRDAQWRAVSGLFKSAMWISAAIALVAEGIHRLPIVEEWIGDDRMGDARAWAYTALMYVISMPVLFMRMRRALSGYKAPNNPMGTRVFSATIGVVLCLCLILSPAIVIELGQDAAARGHSLYRLFSGSVFGTAIIGGVLGYAAAMGAWMLLCGLPRVVFR